MKKSVLCLFFLSCLLFVNAQPKPAMLPEPAAWELEQFSLPPAFAPTISYKGLEELRFSPGMFKKEAVDYFTYIFAARLDNTQTVAAADIKNYLLVYFKGLCGKTAADRKLPPVDTTAISVMITPKKTADKYPLYSAILHIFGVFTDGAPLTLNMEVKVLPDIPRQSVYLLFIASPQPTTSPVWQDLYNVQQHFLIPVNNAVAELGADTARAIDALFERYRPEAPGCELAISRNGQVIYSKAWGMADLEHHVPMTTTSISEAGSVSKQFTAAAILLLEQQGKLSLDDDVRKYVPELPDYGKPILLRQMMHHSSGLRDWGSVAAIAGWPRTTKTYNNQDALDIIVHQQHLNTPPNEAFGYSNSNYNLFAIIVERVSGLSLAAFTKQYIFLPAGMTHTSWRDDHKRVVPDRAIAYDLTRNIYETNLPNEDVYGNGGLLTTAEDLLKWNAWYLGGHLGNPSLLPKQLAVDNFNNGKPNEYGAGLFLSQRYGQLRIEHSGATASYRADLEAFPASALSIAWLSNTSAFDGKGNMLQQVEELFFTRSGSTVPGLQNLPADVPPYSLSAAALQAYTGKYYSEEAQTGFTVIVKAGLLYLYRSPQTMIPLTPTGKDRFSTDIGGFSGERGEIVFLSGNKRMSISVSRAKGVIFNRL